MIKKNLLLLMIISMALTACQSLASTGQVLTPTKGITASATLDVLQNTTTPLPENLSELPPSTLTQDPTATVVTVVPQSYQADMIYIPPGSLNMGSTTDEVLDAIALCREHYNICNPWYYERESPPHAVSLDSFWIDRTEITNAQYRLCVEAGVCAEPVGCDKGQLTYHDPEKVDHPVVCVSWQDAQTFCQWGGGRLPTEAEWEYAFRGRAGLIFPWGDEFDGSRLNYCDQNCDQSHADDRFDDGHPKTARAGSYPQGKSWSGVLNLGGNVSEWTADWFGEYSPSAEINPAGPPSGNEKMLKGCSWFFQPAYCRGAARPSVDPDTRFDYLGFRCAVPGEERAVWSDDMDENLIDVPSGSPPDIDGSMTPGEWDDAAEGKFSDGSVLLLLQADGYLYLGVRSSTPGMIASNVYINQGEKISILHTSAALGTGIFQKGDPAWQRIQSFDWSCRDTGNSDQAQAEREAFLHDQGWLAANSRMGTPEELEYRIAINEDTLRLAVNIIRTANPNERVPWPSYLTDDCTRPTPGGLPEELHFLPEEWVLLQLSSPSSSE